MKQSKRGSLSASTNGGEPAAGSPIEPLLSSRLIVVANLLRRGAALRYMRQLGLSSSEFGIVAMLGRREPTPVRALAALIGMDKAQVSRALSALVSRKLVVRSANPADNRDVLVSLTKEGIRAHDALIATAGRINAQLTEGFSARETALIDKMLGKLTSRASDLLAEEMAMGD